MLRTTLAILSLVLGSSCLSATARGQESPAKQPSFDSAGVPIHYLVTGPEDGEPVVLIHGFAGRIETQWSPIIAALKKGYKIIALDCRGHGGSGKPHDPKKYGLEMVHDVARLLDHLKIDQAHIVGYSMGSGIALRFAVYYPQRVRTLTLGGSSGLNRGHQELISAVADSLEKGNGLGPLVIALAPPDRPKPTPEFIKLVNDAVFSVNDVKALAAVARGAAGDLLSDEQLQSIKVPTLTIIGADDPLRVDIELLKKLLPDAKVTLIDKADHMTAFIKPEFINGLRQFLEAHRQPPAK